MPRSGKFTVPALGLLILLAANLLHIHSLLYPFLFLDDFDILLKSWTWHDTVANLWKPVNEHTWPLTRLSTYAVIHLAERPTAIPLATALYSRVMLVACLGLTYLFVRREFSHPFYGLVATAVFGISAVYQEAVFWYAASPAFPALATTLFALLAAQRARHTGRFRSLVLCAMWCAVAPGWFGGGILAGPLCMLYLLGPGPNSRAGKWRRLDCVVPLIGSLAYLAISLPLAGSTILNSPHYGTKNAVQAFNFATGLLNTGRAIVDNLVLGSFGLFGFSSPLAIALPGPILLTIAGIGWWRCIHERRFLVLGLGFILLNYLLIYSARAEWSYEAQLREWTRYNVFPQLGLALLVASALTGLRGSPETPPPAPPRNGEGSDVLVLKPLPAAGRGWGGVFEQAQKALTLDPTGQLSKRDIRIVLGLIVILFLLQLPHGLIGSPRYEPNQRTVLERIEQVESICRVNGISAADARAVLEPLPFPGSTHDDAWTLLRGSIQPRSLTKEEVKRMLNP